MERDSAAATRSERLTSTQSLARAHSTGQPLGIVRTGIIDPIRCEVLRRELSPKPFLQAANAKEVALTSVIIWVHGLHPRRAPHVIMDHVPLPATNTRAPRFCARRRVHAAVGADRTQRRAFSTRATCVALHLPPRATGIPRSLIIARSPPPSPWPLECLRGPATPSLLLLVRGMTQR